MGEIILKNIYKSFGSIDVIEDLNLTIKDGDFTVLVGASGCGKTTLLRIIAGIGPATKGELYLDGEEVSDLPPGKRDIAMVFQNYAIYPTMKVRDNIEFGLKNRKISKEERTKRIEEVSRIVGLQDYLHRKPNELSGGQRQRVALARAMVKKPSVFLMDEPLSNLDAKLRVAMRSELIEMHQRLKTTFVYVTHDQSEAMSMADTIIVMDAGKIMQEGSPEKIYYDPDNVFTAQFIGTPPMNILPMQELYVSFRPENVVLSKSVHEKATYTRSAVITTREMLGSETIYRVILDDPEVPENKRGIMVKTSNYGFRVGESVTVQVDAEKIYFFGTDQNRIRRNDVSNYNSLLRILER